MKKLLFGIIIALVICTALGVVAKVATPDTISDVFRTYTVEGDVSNGFLGDISKLKAGSSVTVELTAAEGYALPETVSVTGASYEYDQTSGTLTLSNPTENVEIEVVCVPIVWDITSSITNVTVSGDTTIATGGTASVTLTAASGYTLPVTVTVTNATLDSYTGGVVTISNPSGDVTISGACTANTYAITTSVTNATASGDTGISMGGTASVTLTAASGYTLPSTVTVTNATLDSYTGGVVTISNPSGSVTISGACDQVQQQSAQTYTLTITADNTESYRQVNFEIYINEVLSGYDYRIEGSYDDDPTVYDSNNDVISNQLPIVLQDVSCVYVESGTAGDGSITVNGVDLDVEDFVYDLNGYIVFELSSNTTICFHVEID